VKPYYEDGAVTLYHGDCREVSLPRDSADVLIADPPYGVDWRSNHRAERFAHIAGDDSQDVGLAGLRTTLPAVRRWRHVYVFGRFPLEGLGLTNPVELIWEKGQPNGGDLTLPWAPQHEYLQFAVIARSERCVATGYGRLAARLRKGSVLHHPRLNGAAVTRHPTEKPVALLRELIESSSCAGETVLDPFAGVGSTGVAAVMEGRKAVLIELEERYCEVAVERLQRVQAMLPLFEEAAG
jgi:DNA modification methylase